MAIIYSYPPSGGILATDTLVGTSTVVVGGRTKNQTKSFSISSLTSYMNTNVGNDLNQVLTNGNTSLLDAKVGELYLYDTANSAYGKITNEDSSFVAYEYTGQKTFSASSTDSQFIIINANNKSATFNSLPLTAARIYSLPNASGTIALTSNLSTYVPYTGATQAVDLGAFNLTVNNITVGRGRQNINGNTAVGVEALYNTTANNNTALGFWAGQNLITGAQNLFLGVSAGRQFGTVSPLTIGSSLIMIGNGTQPLDNNQYNQIVIGTGAIGAGSNTVTLGDNSIIKTILKGSVGIGTTAPTSILHIVKNQPEPTRINIENIDLSGTSTIRFTNLTGAAAALFENATNQFTFQNATNGGNIRFQTTDMLGSTLTALVVDSDQSVGVGVTIIEKTAKLQVDSNSKGFLPPRMTSLEREDIVSPANGLIVYDTTLQTFCGYADNGWKTFRMDIM